MCMHTQKCNGVCTQKLVLVVCICIHTLSPTYSHTPLSTFNHWGKILILYTDQVRYIYVEICPLCIYHAMHCHTTWHDNYTCTATLNIQLPCRLSDNLKGKINYKSILVVVLVPSAIHGVMANHCFDFEALDVDLSTS